MQMAELVPTSPVQADLRYCGFGSRHRNKVSRHLLLVEGLTFALKKYICEVPMCACITRAENQLEQLLPGPVSAQPTCGALPYLDTCPPSFHSYHSLPTHFCQRKEFQSKDPYVVAAEPGLKHRGSAESLMDRTGKMKGHLMDPGTKKAQEGGSSWGSMQRK